LLIFKRTCSLNSRKRFQQHKQKYFLSVGARRKELIPESLFTFLADQFPTFPGRNWFFEFYAALADSGNWHPDTNSFELQRETFVPPSTEWWQAHH
jgi:hypothetical protein